MCRRAVKQKSNQNFDLKNLNAIIFQAVSFKKTSRNLARSLWWKNIKITIIIVVVVIVSIKDDDNEDLTVELPYQQYFRMIK